MSKEAITATITLDDDDQSTVRRMLTYLYTLDYDDADASQVVAVAASQNADSHVADTSAKPEPINDATISHCKRMNNVRVYALAEKYNIPALKELAKTKFEKCKAGFSYSLYREVVSAVFESTPDTDSGLRNIVILKCANTVEKSLKEEGVAPMIRDHGVLGLGLLREVVKKHKSQVEKQKQDLKTRTIDLRLALGSLHDDAMHIHIPGKEDSQEDFERSYQALGDFQQKLLDVWISVKLED